MWLVKRKTRQRVSSSTPNNLVAEIASAGLSPRGGTPDQGIRQDSPHNTTHMHYHYRIF